MTLLPSDRPLRRQLLVDLGYAQIEAGQLDQAKAAFDEALDAARRAGNDPAAARDNDPRWAHVTDETEVYWEGNWTTWGELAGNERTECGFNEEGVLVGGYRI